MNNIALFVTHSIFLTKEESEKLAEGGVLETRGHCVPVWVDAKTGRTTEPAKEIFCTYRLCNSEHTQREVRIMPRKGYEIFIPKNSAWKPPPSPDYEKMAVWPSEERMAFMREVEKWWFSNPRPPDSENLKSGYLRFECRKNEQRPKPHQQQHVVEISLWDRLYGSLAT